MRLRLRISGRWCTAIRQDLRRPPHLEQEQQRREAYDRADHIRQIGAEINGRRQLASDITERADDRERPRRPHAFTTRHEIKQNPRRQQSQDRHDLADRSRVDGQEVDEAHAERAGGHRSKRDDWCSESAIGNRRIVGNRCDADRIEIGDADRDQDGRDERPRVAKTDQSFEQGAKGPGEQNGLHPHVTSALLDEPAA